MKISVSKVLQGFVVGLLLSTSAYAEPITHQRTASGVDWVSAGISGTGGGSGTITVTGVTGTVTAAYLYWHGVDLTAEGGDGNYDNADITIGGNDIVGTAIGSASTNCWGTGNSVAYRADVSAYVTGDGDYDLAGLSSGVGHNSNGASLVVLFDDGSSGNNRDLVFFEGNDSSVADDAFPLDLAGWTATLSPIVYAGGTVGMEFHVADGQSFEDDTVSLSTASGNLDIADTGALWDGNSLPTAGTSRTDGGELYDIHVFDITSAFGGVTGNVELSLAGQFNPSDCHGLLVALVDLEPGSAPPPPQPEEPVPVPTLGTATLAMLAALMLLIGVTVTRRRQPS